MVCASVQEAISSLWSLDSLGIREPNYSKEKEEELALTQFYNNIQYNPVEKQALPRNLAVENDSVKLT